MPRGGFAECANGCGCRCHKIAAGRAKSTRGPSKRDWSGREIKVLQDCIEMGETIESISKAIYNACTTRRSAHAIRHKANQLGLNVKQGWYTNHEVRSGLGVHHTRVERWRQEGYLPGRRHTSVNSMNVTSWWHFDHDDLMRFIDQYAGILFKPAVVKRPDWKRRAEVAAAANLRKKAG